MADIYVRTDGDDATGDGTTGTPYASLAKGLQSAPLGTVTRILMGDGTYTETKNDAGATVDYLAISRNRTALCTIEPELGSAGDVTVKGGHASYNVIFPSGATTGKLKFRYIKFGTSADTNVSAVHIHGSAIVSDLSFEHCDLNAQENSSATHYGLYCSPAAGKTVTNLSITDCTLSCTGEVGTKQIYGIAVNVLKSAGAATGITIARCTIPSTGCAILVSGATDVTVQDNTMSGVAAIAMLFGTDAYDVDNPATTFAAPVSRNNITGTTTHSVMIGCNVTDIVFEDNTVYGGDIGIVAKNAISPTIRRNMVIGGTTANYALYNKASSSAVFEDNLVVSTKSGSYGFYAGPDATPEPDNTYSSCVLRRNTIIAAYGAIAVGWTPTAGETGALSTSRQNIYVLCNGATLAKWDGDDKTTMAALKAAWVTYGDTGAEAQSRIAGNGMMYARGRLSRAALHPRF